MESHGKPWNDVRKHRSDTASQSPAVVQAIFGAVGFQAESPPAEYWRLPRLAQVARLDIVLFLFQLSQLAVKLHGLIACRSRSQ